MHRDRDRSVADDRDGAADYADAERIEDAAHDVRVIKQLAVMIERQDIQQVDAFAPGHHEGA